MSSILGTTVPSIDAINIVSPKVSISKLKYCPKTKGTPIAESDGLFVGVIFKVVKSNGLESVYFLIVSDVFDVLSKINKLVPSLLNVKE